MKTWQTPMRALSPADVLTAGDRRSGEGEDSRTPRRASRQDSRLYLTAVIMRYSPCRLNILRMSHRRESLFAMLRGW